MAENPNAPLIEYAREQLDDALRTVIRLHEEECEILYLRDDIRKTYSADQYKRVAESFRIDLNADIHEKNSSHIGTKTSVVHYHEGAYVFQFLHDEYHSILLSVEPEVGSQLKSFLEGCQNYI